MRIFKIFMPILLVLIPSVCLAHFGMVVPSQSMVAPENKVVELKLSFSHPFEMVGMELVKPARFGVKVGSQNIDLLSKLKKTRIMGHTAWETRYKVKRPGVYQFYMEPKPYWEPAEDCFIVHYTKTIVAAFGEEEGWDEAVGLKTEIIPLTRPFGLYAGNTFQGQVLVDGKPVPFCDVEIEYYNQDQKAKAPSEYMITQVVKTDANGVFTYTPPRSGWWGFAGLNTADYKLKKNGQEKDVEIGAVLWVQFLDWQEK